MTYEEALRICFRNVCYMLVNEEGKYFEFKRSKNFGIETGLYKNFIYGNKFYTEEEALKWLEKVPLKYKKGLNLKPIKVSYENFGTACGIVEFKRGKAYVEKVEQELIDIQKYDKTEDFFKSEGEKNLGIL